MNQLKDIFMAIAREIEAGGMEYRPPELNHTEHWFALKPDWGNDDASLISLGAISGWDWRELPVYIDGYLLEGGFSVVNSSKFTLFEACKYIRVWGDDSPQAYDSLPDFIDKILAQGAKAC